jgi:hypothetical protein
MHTSVAAGLIRETARLINEGTDVDLAIQTTTLGASREIREAYVGFIHQYAPRVRKVSNQTVKDSILAAAGGFR